MLEIFRDIDGLRRRLMRFDVEPLGEAQVRHDNAFLLYLDKANKAYLMGDRELSSSLGEIVVSMSFVQDPPRHHVLLLGSRLALPIGTW